MRQIAQSRIINSVAIATSRVIQKIKRPVKVSPRRTSLLVTWAMCWYLLATIILIILHGFQ